MHFEIQYQRLLKTQLSSFEYNVPTVVEFKNRIENTLKKYPYLVALIDNKIVGYAYAGSFVGREAYRFSAELTVYVDKDYQKIVFANMKFKTNITLKEISGSEFEGILLKNEIPQNINEVLWYLYRENGGNR